MNVVVQSGKSVNDLKNCDKNVYRSDWRMKREPTEQEKMDNIYKKIQKEKEKRIKSISSR